MALLIQLVDDVAANKFELNQAKLTLGRHPSCEILIDDAAVSSQHAVVSAVANEHFPEYQEFYLEDLDSTNGTFVNDIPVSGKTRLHRNDVVRVAWNSFKFIDDSEPELAKTLHMLK